MEIKPLEHSKESELRRAQLAALRLEEANPFPNDFKPDTSSQGVRDRWAFACTEGCQDPIEVKLAGRIIAKRSLGRAIFLKLQDSTGDLQLFCAKTIPSSLLQTSVESLNLGDIVGVEGTLFLTKTQELTVRLKQIRLLTKAIRPLPEKYHGLTDTEQRYRQRYLDLIVNKEVRERFKCRSKIVSALRGYLEEADFLEVETPMLQTLAGGAQARPFETHHNALNLPLFLRIAPELFLKRLVVGGFDRVFEINRNFRNEGLSTRHNPEFTMCEFYAAYWDHETLMCFIESLFRYVATQALGTLEFMSGGIRFDLAQPFKRLSLLESIQLALPEVEAHCFETVDSLKALCKAHHLPLPATPTKHHLRLTLFEGLVETTLLNPTFITDYPAEVSPLARPSTTNPELAERFELFVAGRELANGFSELNDPEAQSDIFKFQMIAKAQGQEETMPYDTDYIAALEHGMPPTAGAGIGIDRLVMWLTDACSIKDVILFPTLKPA